MRSGLDIEGIRQAHPLPSVVAASLKLQRVGNEWKACCPFHSDRSPSFTIFSGGERFHCFGCGESGDVLDFVQKAHGLTLREAADMLGAGSVPRTDAPTPKDRGKSDTVAAARQIWRDAVDVIGTPAASYLVRRGLTLAPPPTLRLARLRHPEGGTHPCLVALVTSAEGRLAGIQRTYLAEDGAKAAVRDVKLSLGRIAGGAIRCAPAGEELIVSEGLEDGLTLLQELSRPVWVAAGASMLRRMQLPEEVRSVVIGADADAAGAAAATKAAEVFAAARLTVRVIRPAAGFKDFNDELRGGGRA